MMSLESQIRRILKGYAPIFAGYIDTLEPSKLMTRKQRGPMTAWQPIETAPKDGTLVLLFVPDGHTNGERGPGVTVGSYDPRTQKEVDFAPHSPQWVCYDTDQEPSSCYPTHWMRLPSPPEPNDAPNGDEA